MTIVNINGMKIKIKSNISLIKGLERKSSKKVVVLLSGGVDSSASALALQRKGYEIYPLFIDYGQNAAKAEKFLVERFCRIAKFHKPKIVKCTFYKQIGGVDMVEADQIIKTKNAWVEARNTLFMIYSGIYAKKIDADGICLGYMLEDNFVFGDNDYFHHKLVELTLSHSFLQPIEVFMPIKEAHKADLMKMLDEKGLLDLTTSCWNAKITGGNVRSCNKCSNCLERNSLIKKFKRN